MAGTLAWTATARTAASSVDFDSTGASVTLPADTQQLEVYVTEAAWIKLEPLASSVEAFMPITADTWTTVRELDGIATVAIKAVSTDTKVYAQAITPRGTKGGR